MPRGIYKRQTKHIQDLIKRNKSIAMRKKVSKALKGHGFSEETLKKMRDNHADVEGQKNPKWKGGFYITKNGYKFVYFPTHKLRNMKGYVREHLLIIYNYLGDKINKSSIIHHIDGNKLNNKIYNLMVMKDSGSHRRIHCEKTKEGDILFDGRNI